MLVRVLSENTSSSGKLDSEHGLSLYIETGTHKILFDTGASGLFAENAEKLGADLRVIDFAVLSHGHYDHGGGLKAFLGINGKAKVFVHQKAFEGHYANRPGGTKEYIGLDEALLPNGRFVFCCDSLVIYEGLELLSGVRAERLVPSGNSDLLLKVGGTYVRDDFAHEQSLIISENGKTLLIAGCAHNGIVNILEKFKAEKGAYPDYVIGGFHLYDRGSGQNEAPETVDEIGKYLLGTGSQYYTCHCTGIESYKRLKAIMEDNISYISTGDMFTIQM